MKFHEVFLRITLRVCPLSNALLISNKNQYSKLRILAYLNIFKTYGSYKFGVTNKIFLRFSYLGLFFLYKIKDTKKTHRYRKNLLDLEGICENWEEFVR